MKMALFTEMERAVKMGVDVVAFTAMSVVAVPVIAANEVTKWVKDVSNGIKEEKRRKSYQVQWINVD